jgi:hypothetical protein
MPGSNKIDTNKNLVNTFAKPSLVVFPTLIVYFYNQLFIYINLNSKKNYLNSLQIQMTFPIIRMLFMSLP